MKNLLLVIVLSMASISAFAQRDNDMQTLIKKGTRVGAYISFENQFKDFGTEFPGIYSGVRAGLIFNRYLFVGLGAYGLTNEINLYDVLEQGDAYELETGYAGLSLEGVLFPKKAVHVSFPCFFGVGGASIRESGYGWNRNADEDLFWMYQGGANVEMNLTKWIRVSGGVYYTQSEDFSLTGIENNLLSGLSYGMSLKLGRF